jgi:hypothetical protein
VKRPPRIPITANPAYVRARGVFGVVFILFGLAIGFQILRGVGLRFEALPGITLAIAMIALGIVRIKGAMNAGKVPS